MLLSTCKNRFEAFQSEQCNSSEFCIHLLNLDYSGTGARLYFNVHRDRTLYFRSFECNERTVRFDLHGKSPKTVVAQLNEFFAYMNELKNKPMPHGFAAYGFSFAGE